MWRYFLLAGGITPPRNYTSWCDTGTRGQDSPPSGRHGTDKELEIIIARDALETSDKACFYKTIALDDEPALLQFDYERLEGVFPKGREHVRQIVGSAGPAKARQAAMDAERRSNEFFRCYPNQVDRPQGRAMFEQFAKEEERHWAVIREAHDELRTHTGGL